MVGVVYIILRWSLYSKTTSMYKHLIAFSSFLQVHEDMGFAHWYNKIRISSLQCINRTSYYNNEGHSVSWTGIQGIFQFIRFVLRNIIKIASRTNPYGIYKHFSYYLGSLESYQIIYIGYCSWYWCQDLGYSQPLCSHYFVKCSQPR